MQARLTRMAGRGRLARMLARMARGRRGSAAVEFAMIAFPFLALIMGILEISIFFLVSTTLDNATADIARQIRTGQLQTAGGATASSFASSICGELSWLGSSCAANLHVDVRTFSTFTGITQPSPISGGVLNTSSLQFTPGAAGDIVLVRAFYQWTLFTPALDGITASMNGGSTLITSTTVFKNEPYVTAAT